MSNYLKIIAWPLVLYFQRQSWPWSQCRYWPTLPRWWKISRYMIVHRWTIVKLPSIQCNVVVWGIDNTVLWHGDRLLFQTGSTFTVSMPVITSRWVKLTMRRTPAAAAVDPRSPTALAPTRQPRTTQSSRCCNQRTCTAHSVLTTIVLCLVLIMNLIVL